MSRITATVKDVWDSAVHASDAAEKLKRIIFWLLLLLGSSALVLAKADVWPRIEPYIPYFVWPIAVYIAICFIWVVAIAWERNAGPIIWTSSIEFSRDGFFEMTVKNVGHCQVIARVYAQEMRDRNDKRNVRIDDEIELHWRGKHRGDKMMLHGSKPGVAAIFRVQQEPSGPRLCFVVPGVQPNTELVSVLNETPKPLAEQEEIRLTIRIDFSDETGSILKTKPQEFSICPMPENTTEFYRIRKIRWMH
jgi:hypothetical protein